MTQTIVDRFDAACRRFGALEAVRHEGRGYSYVELAAEADGIRVAIEAGGVVPGDAIGVCLVRSFAFVATCWAVLMSGARLLLVDRELPPQRVREMLDEVGVALVVADADSIGLIRDASGSWPLIEPRPAASRVLPRRPIPAALQAYLIFTSGSTGRPKAIAGTHRGLLNRVDWQLATFPMGPGDRALLRTPSSFGDIFWELFGATCAGATLVVAEDRALKDPGAIRRLVVDEHVSHLVLVPTLLEEIVEEQEAAGSERPLALRQINVSGELLRAALMRRAADAFPGVRWLNLYGSSEVAADVTFFAIDNPPAALNGALSVPVGQAIAGATLLLLDEDLDPVPDGQVGELYAGGEVLAHGYVGRPDLTAERFVPNPIGNGSHDATLFRTGDIARKDPGGFVIVGRRDRQVKLRGARVDLDGVESRLASLPGVQRAAVILDENELRAFVQPSAEWREETLWDAVREQLPTYERPSRIIQVERIPLTLSGKIDRLSLGKLIGRTMDRSSRPLSGLTQHALAEVWSALLPDSGTLHADSHFEELGGHSLRTMELARAIERRFGIRVGVAALLTAPILADQANLLPLPLPTSQGRAALQPDLEHPDEPFELTDLQQAYWVSRQTAGHGTWGGSHLYQEWELPQLDGVRLESAWNRLVERHGMLRATVDGDGQIQVLPRPRLLLPKHDLSAMDDEARATVLARHREQQLQEPFRTDTWPLFALHVFQLGGGAALLTFKFDLLIVDAWSTGIMARDLWLLYSSHALRPLALSFRDVQMHQAAQRSGDRWEEDRRYWEQRLEGLSGAPELPLAQEMPADAPVRRWYHVLDSEQTTRLDAVAARLGISRASVLLAAYAAVLRRWSGQHPFTLTLTLFDRPALHPEILDIVGDFTTVLLLQVPGPDPRGFAALSRALHEQLLRDLDHRAFSGVRVARQLRRHRGVYDAMRYVFTYIPQGDDVGVAAFPAGSRQRFRITRTAGVWLDNQVVTEGDGLRLHWDGIDRRFPPGLLDAMFESYVGLIDGLLASSGDESLLADCIAQLPEAQRTRRLAPVSLEHDGDYLPAIERQCVRQPTAVAVIAPDRRVSFGELWQEAGRLARRVREVASVGDECVAVHLAAGWRQVVAALGIQLAGLAYVPLSTLWPSARLKQVVFEHGIRIVVVDGDARGLDGVALVRLTLDESLSSVVDVDHAGPLSAPVAAEPSRLAYVIFTSGSTGSPKGVMMRRGQVGNTLADLHSRLRLTPQDRVLALSELGFDLSVFDIFGLLAAGGAIVIPHPTARLDPSRWWQLCVQYRVTIWNTVPALMEMLADYATSKLDRLGPLALRWVMLSGDWIPLTLPDQVRQFAPQARLLSLGGATEAGIWSVCFPVARVQPGWRSIPYGRPLKGQSCAVVDQSGLDCPEHVVGELLISGGSLSDGYWHRPDLTNAAFVVDKANGQRSYHTGDLARYDSNGVLELLGRRDSQVKINGHRVECMEVESVVSASPSVRSAIVLALQGPRGPELHAAIEWQREPDRAALEAWCRMRLPEWMVPSYWHDDVRLPLNDNGKVDRRQLREWLASRRQAGPNDNRRAPTPAKGRASPG